MAAYFLDTSTVVKRYVREIGTSWVQALAAPAAGHSLIVVRITLAETVAAVTRLEPSSDCLLWLLLYPPQARHHFLPNNTL